MLIRESDAFEGVLLLFATIEALQDLDSFWRAQETYCCRPPMFLIISERP